MKGSKEKGSETAQIKEKRKRTKSIAQTDIVEAEQIRMLDSTATSSNDPDTDLVH